MFPPAFPLEDEIRSRALACRLELAEEHVAALALHARWVLRENEALHLTSITDPVEFLDRHIGEAFEAAAMIDPEARGHHLDLGSGNGSPGLPLAAARPGLHLLMAEASSRKASFLRAVLAETGFPRAAVHEAQVQRQHDLEGTGPFRLITSRAMGGWTKVLPRLHGCLGEEGEILVWAGEETEAVARRVVWRRLRLVEKRPISGRERSWIWRFVRA
jgi:16S rRNA (guanine527-N7)-methyltransferase